MDRNEILARLKKISGIDIPTEEQERDIDELIGAMSASTHTDDEYEAQTTSINELRSQLEDAQRERDEIKERYRKRFWGEEDFSTKKKELPKPKETSVFSLDDII